MLPTSVIEKVSFEVPFSCTYVRAPLTEVSLFNGILKYDHPQVFVSEEEFFWVQNQLDFMFGGLLAGCHDIPYDEAAEQLVDTTSSGVPYTSFAGSSKGEVLKRLGVDGLVSDLRYLQLLNCTLKDELRPVGKDARLFRPANVASVLEGIALFSDQNERLMSSRYDTPFQIGVSSPGADMSQLWGTILGFSDMWLVADVNAMDARFPVWLIETVRLFRRRYFESDEVRERIDRYYREVYYGYTKVDVTLVQLIGNASGQFNTAHDNTIAMIAAFLLACRRTDKMVSLAEVRLYGDDVLMAVRDPTMTHSWLRESFEPLGIYLETPVNDYATWEQLSFIGTRPLVPDGRYYHYDTEKLLSALHYWKHKKPIDNYISKVCAVCLLCAFDQSVIRPLRAWATDLISIKFPEFARYLPLTTEAFALRVYFGYEGEALAAEASFLFPGLRELCDDTSGLKVKLV